MKKIAAIGLCLCLAIGLMPQTALAATAAEDEVLSVLAVMGILNGDERGNLNLTATVTRAQFVKMAVSASSFKSQGQAPSALSPYPDVKAGAWHSGYITVARDNGLISGYLDGSFRPDSYVTLEEAVSVMLKAMGYSGTDFAAGYPAAHMALYQSLDLDDGMTARQGQNLTRRDCAQLIYNCLNAKTKSGVYAAQLGYAVDAQGKINYAALTTSLAQGPVMKDAGSIQSTIGFTPVSVYRDRRLASLEDIAYGDVLYYIKDVGTVWAYSQKISGKLQSISPSTANPSAVTVSGITCQLGSSSAIYAFSDLGTVKVGDSVTLLLGAGGQCVFVLTGQETEQTVYGAVTSVGTQAINDSFGSAVQGNYITVAATDGNSYVYPYSGSLDAGDVAKVTVSGGDISISRAKSSANPSGTVKNGKLGSYTIDDNTEILDFHSSRAVCINADRLEGVSIRQNDVALCLTDGDSHVEKLVLKNVTGDMLDYGVATTVSHSSNIMYYPSSYVYIVKGVPNVLSVQATYKVEEGPCAIEYDGAQVKSLSTLTGKKVQETSAFSMTLQGLGEMKLSDDVQVYVKDGDEYYLSGRMNVSLDTHEMRAYYDGEAKDGGRIRVIIAEEK